MLKYVARSFFIYTSVAALVSLDVKVLTRELKSVQKRWFELGLRLGVRYSVLKAIKNHENERSDLRAGPQMIRHMLQYWLKSNPSCSWSIIIKGLREIDEFVLARTLESKYLPTDQSIESPGKL